MEWTIPWRDSNDTPIMIAWDKQDLENIDLPQDWIKGCFEIVNIDTSGSLMMLWIVGDCARAADTLSDNEVPKNFKFIFKNHPKNFKKFEIFCEIFEKN